MCCSELLLNGGRSLISQIAPVIWFLVGLCGLGFAIVLPLVIVRGYRMARKQESQRKHSSAQAVAPNAKSAGPKDRKTSGSMHTESMYKDDIIFEEKTDDNNGTSD